MRRAVQAMSNVRDTYRGMRRRAGRPYSLLHHTRCPVIGGQLGKLGQVVKSTASTLIAT